eukprot:1364441-Amorphochlora_amoeboformis.AAC.1
MVTAFEKKGQWIRHSRGWTLTLMKKSSLMVQITSEDEELDFLIYKFTGLRDEVRFTTKRLVRHLSHVNIFAFSPPILHVEGADRCEEGISQDCSTICSNARNHGLSLKSTRRGKNHR